MRLLALALMLVLTGCGGPDGMRPSTEHGGAGGPIGPSWVVSEDPLSSRMREVASRLAEAGLRPGRLEGRGFLAPRENRTIPLRIPARLCVSIVAIASSGISDVDATLYAPSGDVLADDVEPDAHPTLQICGGEEGRRGYYHLAAYAGAGVYLFAAFVGDRESFAAVTRIVGGRPGIAADDGSDLEEDSRLRAFREGAARRGFRPVRDPEEVPLAADQRVRVPLAVESAHCYTVGAFAGEGLADVDLRVLDQEGGEVVRDVSPTEDPAAQFCVDADAEFAVELHAKRGAGEARLVLFKADESVSGGESGLWLGQRRVSVASTVAIDEAIERDVAAARAAGWGAAGRRVRVRLARGEAVSEPVTLPARRCTRLVATGGRGIGRLGVRVVGEDGTVLGATVSTDATAVLRLCPDRTVRAEVQIISRGGEGEVELTGFSRAVPPFLPATATGLDRGAILDAVEEATERGYTLDRIDEINLTDEPARIELPAGEGCERVAVVAAAGDGSVSARLLSGRRVSANEGGRVARFIRCGPPGILEVRRDGETGRAFVVRMRR